MTQLGAVNPWSNTVLVTCLTTQSSKSYGLLNLRLRGVKFNFGPRGEGGLALGSGGGEQDYFCLLNIIDSTDYLFELIVLIP